MISWLHHVDRYSLPKFKYIAKDGQFLEYKNANIHKVLSLAKNFQTPGRGNIQRISITRVLLKKPDTLIFDEPTSALDSRTEKTIREFIWPKERHDHFYHCPLFVNGFHGGQDTGYGCGKKCGTGNA